MGRVSACTRCGISEWQGCPLSLHLDHVNGVNNDNRLENLRFLCPNCHSQTESYCKKGRGGAAR
ncbi:MAG: HNH endonuclease [Gemmataceae bacterium]|nr:HNH endonuclease [Gemmataceae bacterium]